MASDVKANCSSYEMAIYRHGMAPFMPYSRPFLFA